MPARRKAKSIPTVRGLTEKQGRARINPRTGEPVRPATKAKALVTRDVTQTMGANSNTRALLRRMGYTAD